MEFKDDVVVLNQFCIKVLEVIPEHCRGGFAVNCFKMQYGLVKEWSMVGAILIHVLMLMRKIPQVVFISERVLEALVKGRVVLGGSDVSLNSSCLPSHYFGMNGINWNLTIFGFPAVTSLYMVIWNDLTSQTTS